MGVLVEVLSVIIPVSLLEKKYPGGVDSYRKHAPNGTFCTDSHLTRIGFMTPPDVKDFIDSLQAVGLVFHDGKQFVDVAIVDQNQGPTSTCSWLQAARSPRGFGVAWLQGTSPSPMAAPSGWSADQSSQLVFVPNTEAGSRTLPLGRQGGMDILLDFATGRQVYVGRTTKNKGLILEEPET